MAEIPASKNKVSSEDNRIDLKYPLDLSLIHI